MDPTDLYSARCSTVDVQSLVALAALLRDSRGDHGLRKSWVTEFCMRLVNGTVPEHEW
jgi:hypothetical protein